MPTFIATTLTKRTGATTTVFNPQVIASNTGLLTAAGSYVNYVPRMELRSTRSGGARRTVVRFALPQVDLSGPLPVKAVNTPSAQVVLYIPDGTLQTDVNDIVGYVNAATASGLTNLNDILVNGIGVY